MADGWRRWRWWALVAVLLAAVAAAAAYKIGQRQDLVSVPPFTEVDSVACAEAIAVGVVERERTDRYHQAVRIRVTRWLWPRADEVSWLGARVYREPPERVAVGDRVLLQVGPEHWASPQIYRFDARRTEQSATERLREVRAAAAQARADGCPAVFEGPRPTNTVEAPDDAAAG